MCCSLKKAPRIGISPRIGNLERFFDQSSLRSPAITKDLPSLRSTLVLTVSFFRAG
jgi:hypothetical protein